jgi:hypothetical protein
VNAKPRGILWAIVEGVAGWLSRHYSPYQVVRTHYGSRLAITLAISGRRDPFVLVAAGHPASQVARLLPMPVMPVGCDAGGSGQ